MVLTLSKSLVHCKFHLFKCTLRWVEASPETSQTGFKKNMDLPKHLRFILSV